MFAIFLAPLLAALIIGTLFKTVRTGTPMPEKYSDLSIHFLVGVIAAALGVFMPTDRIADVDLVIRIIPVGLFAALYASTFLTE